MLHQMEILLNTKGKCMKKGREGENEEKKENNMEIVATNAVASRPPYSNQLQRQGGKGHEY